MVSTPDRSARRRDEDLGPPRRSPSLARAALALALACASPACTALAEERCEARCECVGCTDAEIEACVADVGAEADTAEAYGCGDRFEAYVDCELTRSLCRDGRYFLDGIDCSDQASDLNECKVRGSSLD